MSNLRDFIGGSGNSGFPFGVKITKIITDTNYVAPYAGEYIVICVGGGGGGSGSYSYPCGGGGSGALIKKITLTKDESVTVLSAAEAVIAALEV